MKRMNFIDKMSAHKHQQISRWFLVSSLSIAGILVCITVFQGLELYELRTVKAELSRSQTHLDALQLNCQEKQTLENKKASLSTMRSHIFSCTLSPCNPHDTLCMLTKLSTLPINLQSVQLHQESLDMTAHAHTLEHATNALAQLKKGSQFARVELISISPGQKGLLLKIRGKK
jgi:hypothetical protein